MKTHFLLLALLLSLIHSKNVSATQFLVSTTQEIKQIHSAVKPGDSIILLNKTWMDNQVELQFVGTESKPIYVLPQSEGSVIFSGTSTVKLGGSYTIVEGFVFKNISSKTIIIEFRTDKENLANNCRVSNCVIDNCNPPNRL